MSEYRLNESTLKDYEKTIAEELRGWVSIDKLQDVLPGLKKYDVRELKDYVNDRDKINIKSTNGTATKSSYFIQHKTDEPYKEYKQKIPEETHDVFEEWVGAGKAPRVVSAVIYFLTEERQISMKRAGERFDCCAPSISNHKQDMKSDLRAKDVELYN